MADKRVPEPPRTKSGMLDELEELRELASKVRDLFDCLDLGVPVADQMNELGEQLRACERLMPAADYRAVRRPAHWRTV